MFYTSLVDGNVYECCYLSAKMVSHCMVCVSIQGTLLVGVVTDTHTAKSACLWLCQTPDGMPHQ